MLVRGFHLITKASHRRTQIFTDVRRSEFLNLCFIRVNPWRKSFLIDLHFFADGPLELAHLVPVGASAARTIK